MVKCSFFEIHSWTEKVNEFYSQDWYWSKKVSIEGKYHGFKSVRSTIVNAKRTSWSVSFRMHELKDTRLKRHNRLLLQFVRLPASKDFKTSRISCFLLKIWGLFQYSGTWCVISHLQWTGIKQSMGNHCESSLHYVI